MTLPVQRITDTGGTRIGHAIRHRHQWLALDDRHRIASEHDSMDEATEAVRKRVLDPALGLSHGERDAAQVVEVSRWLAQHGVEVSHG